MSIMRRLFSSIAKRKMRRVEYNLNHPIEVMEQKLNSILQHHRDTVLGRKYGLKTINSPEEYAENVPLSDYDSMEPYLKMVYENPDGCIMAPEPVIQYLKTSGTSGQQKNLPITDSGRKQVAAGGAVFFMSFMNSAPGNDRILDGTMLLLGAPAKTGEINGVNVGYGTGYILQHQNRVFRRLIAPGEDVLSIMDMEEKMRAYAVIASQVNVTALQGIATLSLSLMKRMQNDYGPWVLEQLKGTKHEDRIRKSMYDGGKLDVAELWPNLRLFAVGGIDTDPYREWIHKALPDVTIWEGYASSEGFYGCQTLPEPGVQLLPDLNYLEFIPENEIDKPHPEVVPLSDVKEGFRYEMVVTNCNGWYRYRLGDVMTFTSIDPYTVRGIARKGRVVNLAGEKVSEAHVTNAMAEACRRTGAEVMDYTVVGVPPDANLGLIGHYAIAAMFKDDNVDSFEFVNAFEQALSEANWEFANSRGVGGLGPTTIHKMVISHHQELVSRTHLQAKPVPLTSDQSVLATCEAF